MRIAVLASLLLAGCGSSPAPRGEKPPLQAALEEAPPGTDFQAFLTRAARECAAFRRSLLDGNPAGSSRARLLGEAIAAFREEARPHLEGRRSIAGFVLTAEEIGAAIAGTGRLSGESIYGPFTGKWYGLWRDLEVDHHWKEIVGLDPGLAVPADKHIPAVCIQSYQYAWVGDGYGLNLVATEDPAAGGKDFLIGYVVHLKDRDLRQEVARVPHVGIHSGAGKIIWITAAEVFLEECYKTSAGGDAYAITGFRYRLQDKRIQTSEGFQAIYTRNPESRPAWYGFRLRPGVAPPAAERGA